VNEASLPTAVEAVQLQGTGHAGLKVESFLRLSHRTKRKETAIFKFNPLNILGRKLSRCIAGFYVGREMKLGNRETPFVYGENHQRL
jgi:hypothetical protein